MVTECILGAVASIHLEIAMSGSSPTLDDVHDVDFAVINEDSSRLLLTAVSGIAVDADREKRFGHDRYILILKLSLGLESSSLAED
jgi:hypothetical protein